MTSKTNFINHFLLAFTLAFISSGLSAGTLDFKDKKKDKEKKEELTADGPYVLYQPDGQIRVINVDKKGNIIDTTYTTLPQNFTLHVTDHKGRFPFDVKLHPVKRPGWNYPQADKVFVMSDPHGRLDCVISLLQDNHIIDKDYKWSFGKNHLMIIGDILTEEKMYRKSSGYFTNWKRKQPKPEDTYRSYWEIMNRWCWPMTSDTPKKNIKY